MVFAVSICKVTHNQLNQRLDLGDLFRISLSYSS